MPGNTIGEAYIQIKPSMEGLSDEVKKALGDAGESGSSSFGSKFSSGLKIAGAAAGAALTAAGTAVGNLTKSAVTAYADYEQLVGGVETLFGQGGNSLEEYAKTVRATARDIEESGIDWDKYMDTAWMSEGGGIQSMFEEIQYNIDELGVSSQELEDYLHFEYDLDVDDAKAAIQSYYDAVSDDTIQAKYEAAGRAQEAVMQHAAEAYKTAGMSANDYMETVTSFSASLLQSLGGDTEEAARVADMAIIDMADNANKMGSSMESIQNAYQGFAKQNYTMLDNLKLGYGGTKEEMQRLLTDAEALSGVEYDMSNLNDVYEAIHVIQESMGIAGTTAKEGASTISGSLASLSASWQNLVTGIADPNQDLGALVGQFIDSAVVALDNLMPTIEQALVGIADALVVLVPVISERLPGLLEAILPALIEASIGLLNGLVAALPTILQILIEQLPMMIQAIVDAVITLLPMILDLGLQLIMALADGIIQNLPTLIPAVIDILLTIVDKLTQPDMLSQLIGAALQLIIALAEGIIKALPQLIARVPEIIINIVKALVAALPMIFEAAVQLIGTLIEGIVSCFSQIIETGKNIIDTVKDGVKQKIEDAKNWGKDLIKNFIEGIKGKWNDLKDSIKGVGDIIKDRMHFSVPDVGPLSDADKWAPDFMDLFASGIRNNIGLVTSAVDQMATEVGVGMGITPVLAGSRSSELASYQTAAPQIAAAGAGGGDIIIPVYVGNEKLDELVVRANQRANYRSGGR